MAGKQKFTAQMVDKIEKSKPTAFVARHVNKRFAKYFTAFFANIGLSPNDVTLLSFIVGLIASLFFALGNYHWVFIGAILTELSLTLDSCDGELARLTGKSSRGGRWFDGVCDGLKKVALFGGISIGQFMVSNNPIYLVLGFFAISNIYLIEEINSYTNLFIPSTNSPKKPEKKPEFILKGDYIGLIDTISLLIFVFGVLNQLLLLLIILSVFPIPIWIKQLQKGLKRIKNKECF